MNIDGLRDQLGGVDSTQGGAQGIKPSPLLGKVDQNRGIAEPFDPLAGRGGFVVGVLGVTGRLHVLGGDFRNLLCFHAAKKSIEFCGEFPEVTSHNSQDTTKHRSTGRKFRQLQLSSDSKFSLVSTIPQIRPFLLNAGTVIP